MMNITVQRTVSVYATLIFKSFFFQDLSTNSPPSIRHVLPFFSAENLV